MYCRAKARSAGAASLRGGHQGHSRGRQGGQFQGPVRKHFKGAKIPGIDADHPGPGGQRGLHFPGGVHLHQGLQTQGAGQQQQGPELPQFQQGDDEQQGVGSQRRGLVNLNRLQDKILAQDGEVDHRPHPADELRVAFEIMGLRQDRDRRGAVVLIDSGQLHRVPAQGQVPLAGGGPLDFGDDGRSGGAVQGALEADRLWPPGDLGLKGVNYSGGKQSLGILQFPGDDFR